MYASGDKCRIYVPFIWKCLKAYFIVLYQMWCEYAGEKYRNGMYYFGGEIYFSGFINSRHIAIALLKLKKESNAVSLSCFTHKLH